MKNVMLISGENLIIREATEDDAESFLSFIKAVGDETDHLTFSGSDITLSIEEEKKFINDLINSDNQTCIVALIGDKVVCQLSVHSSPKARLKHIGEFGISTRKSEWGKGIATEVLGAMIDWAKANPVIKKINLKANVTNTRAIKLYERLGFVHEGIHPRDFYINGSFLDSVSMGMIID